MKIAVEGKLFNRFREVFRTQGHEIVDAMGADLLVSQTKYDLDIPVFGYYDEFPKKVLPAVGLGDYNLQPEFYVCKFFSGEFRNQTLIVIELPNLLNDDLGPKVSCGSLTGFVHSCPKLDAMFDNELLKKFVSEFNHIGFVSIGIRIQGVDALPCSLAFGFPKAATFSLMESYPTDLPSYFFGTDQDLMESWIASLLISRWPWPLHENVVEMKGVTPQIQKHFWHTGLGKPVRDTIKAVSGIGFITAWADNAREACRRCVRTAQNIEFEYKQYRTDMIVKGHKIVQSIEQTGIASFKQAFLK